ncbi:MAG: hypothetical protein HAW59_05040, partial [Betaproteobacteria bacterium]|nr:hypothetical protein [Betaproteobacteria bacterium]
RGDAFRAGIEAPLGETNTVRHPTLSAAAKIGADKNTAHLQLYRELKGGGKSGARFLFRREF